MNASDSPSGTIAAKLRLSREQSGLSQGQVAKMLGLHRPAISEIEAGRRRITAEELAKLAEIYGVSLSWLTTTPSEAGESNIRIELAARQLAKLDDEDLNRLLELIRALKVKDEK